MKLRRITEKKKVVMAAAPASSTTVDAHDVDPILERLSHHMVPAEAYPSSAKHGKDNYTIHAPSSGAVVEVHVKNERFRMMKFAAGYEELEIKGVRWSSHGGAPDAWAFVKSKVG